MISTIEKEGKHLQPAEGFARLLLVTEEPCVQKFISTQLESICARIESPVAALLCVTDGRFTALKGASATPPDLVAGIPFPRVPGPVLRTSEVENRFGAAFTDADFPSHVCIPSGLCSSHIANLHVLSSEPDHFDEDDVQFVSATGRYLLLALHHMIYFPEMNSEWMATAPVQEESPKGTVKAAQTAQGEKTDNPVTAGPAVLAEHLPKGINPPTLKAVCSFLDNHPAGVSRKGLAKGLGFSEVTAGCYLAFLEEAGILTASVSYGRAGRPPQQYTLAIPPGCGRLQAIMQHLSKMHHPCEGKRQQP